MHYSSLKRIIQSFIKSVGQQLSTSEQRMSDNQDLQEWYSSQDEQISVPQLEKKSKSMLPNEACLPLKKYMYNMKYNFVHSDLMPISSLQRRTITLSKDCEPTYLLGNAYYYQTMQELVAMYRKIIWISYRTNKKIGRTDAGWGCMIRVIQMVLAEVLKRNNPEVKIQQIIKLFKEGSQHIFSIDNICSQGNIKQRWTGSTEVLSIISSMLRNQQKKSLLHSQINFHVEPQIYYGSLHLKNTEESENQLSFPKMIIISTKIQYGCNQTIPVQFLDHLKHLMKIETFCGMVGGVSNQALYIVGFNEDKAIVLDPHYIQDQTQENSETRYFKKTPRGIPLTKLRPSISFCFYFPTINQYRVWGSQICYSYRIYSPFKIFQIEAQDENSIEKYRKRSEDFEIL